MITNERQYKITRSEAENFKCALAEFEQAQAERTDVHPRLLRAEKEALKSQLQDLLNEIDVFEALKSSKAPVIEINDFSKLADGLIKARIAAGLSQKDLAERVGLKPQQIQRYEAEKYAGASFKRLTEIVNALGIRITNDIFIPYEANDFEGLTKKVAQVGLDINFLVTRLMGSKDVAIFCNEVPTEDLSRDPLLGRLTEVLGRIYGWSRDTLFKSPPLRLPLMAAAEARFKMPARRDNLEASVYAAYAHYLALVVHSAMKDEPIAPIPNDPEAMHDAIISAYGEMTLRTALNYAWDLGVAILPLNDGGTFHGACWRYGGRNVVVLKQRSPHLSRWLFDLFHELYHASQHVDEETFEVIEAIETSTERLESDEEVMASQFAGEVVLNGRAEELAQLCATASAGHVPKLKSVVQEIALKEEVDLGSLANYLAFRLSWQGINWWGAAANLQRQDDDPWLVARDVFFERFSFKIEDTLDRDLLDRALEKG